MPTIKIKIHLAPPSPSIESKLPSKPTSLHASNAAEDRSTKLSRSTHIIIIIESVDPITRIDEMNYLVFISIEQIYIHFNKRHDNGINELLRKAKAWSTLDDTNIKDILTYRLENSLEDQLFCKGRLDLSSHKTLFVESSVTSF